MPPQTDALCGCPSVEPPRSAQGALTPHRRSPRRTSHQQPAGVAIHRASSADGFSPGNQCCIWAQEHALWIRWTAYMSDDRLEPTNARSSLADRPPPGPLARLDANDTLIGASQTGRIGLASRPWTEDAIAVLSAVLPALEFRWSTDEGPRSPRRETPDPPLQPSLEDEAFRALILSPHPVVKPKAK
jgi:hypothetical protein